MMSWLRYLAQFFASRAFWVFVGLLALALFIWFAGPLFAFAEHRPLESARARAWLIGVLFALYLLWLVSVWWRRRAISARVFERISRFKDASIAQARESGPGAEVLALQQRFAEAAQTLKRVRVRSGRNFWGGRRYLYELPWYAIVGAPGSGKTAALVNAGLDFPLEGQFGKAALQGVGGTHNCDWWFTDQAVLIDTAGRYATHDSDPAVDLAEWQGFLSLLKKYRPRQPLNGIIVTLSTSDLLTLSDAELLAHFHALRARLDELQHAFGIELPVYLWVTKLDLLAGFNEFFAQYGKDLRNQVLGFTFPHPEHAATAKGQTASGRQPTLDAFDEEWALLQRALYSVQDAHLAAETDLRRRNLIHAFPQQFSGLQERVGQALECMFAPSRLARQPLLRGVYFCSGTQEGPTLDRVLTRLGHHFASAGPVPSAPLPPPGTGGRSYFLHDLLLRLIFPEAQLAGRNLRWERRARMLAWCGYAACVLGLVGAISAWTLSYHNNTDYLEQVGENATHAAELTARYSSENEDLQALLDLLTQVEQVGDTPEFVRAQPPLSYQYGLYQGEKVALAADLAYERILRNGLLPLVARTLELRLQQPPTQDLEYLYEALKAYLMLQQGEHYSADFLRHWVGADFRHFVLPDADAPTFARIQRHLDALFTPARIVASPYPENEPLVAHARSKLATLSSAQRAYYRLRSRLLEADPREFNLLEIAGPQAANIFTRQSGLGLNRGVPSLFTHDGYWQRFDAAVEEVVAAISEDEGWVQGLSLQNMQARLDKTEQAALVREVRILYLREYQQVWAQYLDDVQLLPSDTLQTSIQRLSVLSGADSPLPPFVRAVVRETTLLPLPPSEANVPGAVERVTQRLRNTRDNIERVIGPTSALHAPVDEKLERIVDDYFEPLRRLVGHPGAPPTPGMPIDDVMRTLDEYYANLIATDAAVRSGMPPPPPDAAIRLRTEASRLPEPLGQMLGDVASASSRQATRLVRSQIASSLNSAVGEFCRTAVAGRYPLNRASESDVTAQDFARLFAPGGLMDAFFRQHLAPIVDVGTWTFKRHIDGSSFGGNEVLRAFRQADIIRSVYFAGAQTQPGLRLDMRVIEMDPAIFNLTLDVDGNVLRYSHGPQLNQSITWPGPAGRRQVLLQVNEQDGSQHALSASGAWALHRFFDKLVIAASSRSEAFTATATVNGRRVVFEITAASVQNPFRLPQLQGFTCPGRF